MRKSGAATREKILDSAESLVYRHGFSATSIDKVIDRAGVTKGAFFYHFKSKAELARALIERYAARDVAQFDATMARAETLARDPLQQLLVFVGLLQEQAAELVEPAPGCLFASYVYEHMEYPAEVADITRRTLDHWRDRLTAKLKQVAAVTPAPVDLESLANHLLVVIEGGYIVSKAMDEPRHLVDELAHYRSYLEMLFPAPRGG